MTQIQHVSAEYGFEEASGSDYLAVMLELGQPPLDFFYDDDYTNPIDPQFADFNGDGVYELILSGDGHNTYVSVYQWENGAFTDTGVGYYSGD